VNYTLFYDLLEKNAHGNISTGKTDLAAAAERIYTDMDAEMEGNSPAICGASLIL